MSVRSVINATEGIYFITFTCYDWLPLFSICNAYHVVYKWFDHLKANKHYIIGYVIMSNHVHAIIAFSNTGKNINTIVANGKRFMAYELVEILKDQNHCIVLEQLKKALSPAEVKAKKLHKVFEPSFDWKECGGEKFMDQKLQYIHMNPCKAGIVKQPELYPHSSARFYITNDHGAYEVISFMALADIDLTNGKR